MPFKTLEKGHQPRSDQQTLGKTDLCSRVKLQSRSAERRKNDYIGDGNHKPLETINEVLMDRRVFI